MSTTQQIFPPLHLTSIDGIEYTMHFSYEDSCMYEHFVNQYGWTEKAYEEIEDFYWFTATVEASKAGIVLGSDSLGGNCYKCFEQVIEGMDKSLASVLGGYAPQMIEEAKTRAESKLLELL